MPTFYMMVGLPGSGKTYYANAMENVVVHSSDAIRAEVLGDISDQTQQDVVFTVLHNRVFADLRHGRDVVYDATNINYRRRKDFLQRLDSFHYPNLRKVCIFMATPYKKCLENNIGRERIVPPPVITRMYRSFDVPMFAEGWDEIRVEKDEEADGTELMKRLSILEHDNPHHQLTVGQHLLAAYNYLCSHYLNELDTSLGFATYLHDIGKEFTKAFANSDGLPTDIAHFYQHERVGAYDSFAYTKHLPLEDRLEVALLIRWHMYPYAVEKSENPEKTKKRLLSLIGNEEYEKLLILHECDEKAN